MRRFLFLLINASAALSGCTQPTLSPPVTVVNASAPAGPTCIYEGKTYGIGMVVNDRMCKWAENDGFSFDELHHIIHKQPPEWRALNAFDRDEMRAGHR